MLEFHNFKVILSHEALFYKIVRAVGKLTVSSSEWEIGFG